MIQCHTWYHVSCARMVQPLMCADTYVHTAANAHAAAAMVLSCESDRFDKAQSKRCQWPRRRKPAAKYKSVFSLSHEWLPASDSGMSSRVNIPVSYAAMLDWNQRLALLYSHHIIAMSTASSDKYDFKSAHNSIWRTQLFWQISRCIKGACFS